MRNRRAFVLALVLVLVLGLLPAARAFSTAAKEFFRQWAAAGQDEEKKRKALDDLAAEDRTEEAAKIYFAIAAKEEEAASIVELALRHMAELEGQPGDKLVLETLAKGAKWPERVLAARAVGMRTSEASFSPLQAALKDKQWQVVSAAIDGLARRGTKPAVEALISGYEGLDEKDEAGRRLGADYRDALERLTGQRLSSARDYRNWWKANEEKAKLSKEEGKPRIEKEGVTEERAPRLFYDIASRRVIFILDISASMSIPTGAAKSKEAPRGITRFEAMRREAKRVVSELPPEAKFNLIVFSDSALPFAPKLQIASDEKKKSAAQFIDRLKPEGQTNSFGALELAFKDKDVDTIYFLSDGFPTSGKLTDYTRICAEVKKWNATRSVKIHTIAFLAGDGKPLGIEEGNKSVPKAFMQQLAEESGGNYRLVE
jgi:hypothetical protein